MIDIQSINIISKPLVTIVLISIFLIISCKTEEPQNPPTVLTRAASDITTKNATLNGEVTEEGYSSVSDRGFVFSSQNTNPTLNDSKVQSGVGKGVFSTVLDRLQANTKYYYKAYATNNKGTSYGEAQSFTSADYKLPTVATDAPINITYTTVELSGSVSEEGGGSVSESGFVVGLNASPTTADLKFPVSKGKTSFNLVVVKLIENTKYFVRAYAINEKGIVYGNEQYFSTANFKIPTVITYIPKNVSYNSCELSASISDEGGLPITQKGVCYSLNSAPTILDNKVIDGEGTSNFNVNLSNLKANSIYFVRAFAINAKGIGYGNEKVINTLKGPVEIRDLFTRVVEVKSRTGRIWMDRNLGASQAAISSVDTSAFGDLFQWGRGADGHQNRKSNVINTLSNVDQPNNGNFIIAQGGFQDWRSPQNDNLWQGVNGVNNPCPLGFRLPTAEEWNLERLSWSSNNSEGAMASPLKLTIGGVRNGAFNYLVEVGSFGRYLSSTIIGQEQKYLKIGNSDSFITNSTRASGNSVRCIKD